jgi:hypothetical protein
LYALLPVLAVATTAIPLVASVFMQMVKRKTLRRPTVHDAEGLFIVHLLNPETLKKRLKPVR